MEKTYDFGGWATKNNLLCSDGRIICQDAFKHYDGKKVPLVWMHEHSDSKNVLGHAILENRKEGLYAYCVLNNTERGKDVKEIVQHGDVESLSIWANRLNQKGNKVMHGEIREVSIVLAGANPGASIEEVMMHSDDTDESGIIYTGDEISLSHSDDEIDEPKDEAGETEEKPEEDDNNISHADGEKTVADVFNSMSEEQKNVVYAMIGQALEDSNEEGDEAEGGNEQMKHNVFDKENQENQENILSHDDMATIITDAKRFGSLKESFLAHAQEYGIENIDYLFPEAKDVTTQPGFIKRETTWVQKVMGSIHNVPFSRIKSTFADITEEEARAKGYIKGNLKKEEVFSLLKRTTTPTTIYKKQKLDRDDVIDITDFDVVAWLKSEMRIMLDEEIARAILIGDGRLASSDDKINDQNIRPVVKDAELYTVRSLVSVAAGSDADTKAKAFIRASIKARKSYKGSGNPSLYTTEDQVTDCLLLEDKNGRIIYDSIEKLATVLRVKEIVTVPVMEGAKGPNDKPLLGVVVNLMDYNVGADKGGAINMFDDFDIDYNQQKYLIETRCSGALVKPHSAITFELDEATA